MARGKLIVLEGGEGVGKNDSSAAFGPSPSTEQCPSGSCA